MSDGGDRVDFDILLKEPVNDRGESVDGKPPQTSRPSAATIERCRRWLDGQGVACQPTAFGLACSAPEELFSSVFRVELVATAGGSSKPPFEMGGDPHLPEDIAEFVEQLSIGVTPELFSG